MLAPDCRRCPRLVVLRRRVRRAYPDYHAAPVPVFGPAGSSLLIIGLAPGMHGANATGLPFTARCSRYNTYTGRLTLAMFAVYLRRRTLGRGPLAIADNGRIIDA